MAPDTALNRQPAQRVRLDTRLRCLRVNHIYKLSPNMLRIELAGDMEGFQSPGFDDHIKLFLPDPVTGELVLPGGENGEARPIARDYTPRRFNVAAGTLTLDFALHGLDGNAGPATRWAATAKPGDILHLGGPRGSMIPATGFTSYLLIGDETALPAIARRLEGLPAGTQATVLVEVQTAADRLNLETRADADIVWVVREASDGTLVDAVKALPQPVTQPLAWIAGEIGAVRQIRDHLVSVLGFEPQWLKASGYWQKGEAGAHGKVE
ncbi:siderophore-interacting protein [Niveispirillum irakense]|uniref:siderophore-interacting protein n=1 Tax=Niveispirillum irakense TaxID=34011 RepID=UPI000417C436|nr:siderophore-interacting protein [Niveispirillum irakense]